MRPQTLWTLAGTVLLGGAALLSPLVLAQPPVIPQNRIKEPTTMPAPPAAPGQPASPLDFTMKTIDGKDQKLSEYGGKVVLIVNVASKCGLTPQYEGLEKLYKKYADQGLVIVGFPANDFGAQEPGTDAQIKQFCSSKYNVTFPMMSKISVKGGDQHPLYKFLTDEKTDKEFAGDIEWNFAKFLLDRNGNVIARFGSRTPPDDAQLTQTIEKALAAKAAPGSGG